MSSLSKILSILLLLLLPAVTTCFSWQLGNVNCCLCPLSSAGDTTNRSAADQQALSTNNRGTESDKNAAVTLSTAHETALRELQQLESKPTCHRIAARQLMNNCRYLHANEESTNAHNKDFMGVNLATAYAISLALCDLGRGGFHIPSTCEKFGEAVVASLPVTKKAVLHVSSKEIDGCLQSLAQVDSLWGTFMSYNHKSAGFCQVAQAENEKDATILLHKKIASIMASLTETIDKDLQSKLQSLNDLVKDSSANLEHLHPEVKRLRADLASLQEFVTHNVAKTATASVDVIQSGLDEAGSLRELLHAMVVEFQGYRQAAAEENIRSLDIIAEKAQNEFLPINTAISETLSLAQSLRQLIQFAGCQALESANRQEQMEKNFLSLEAASNRIRVSQEVHEKQLMQAQAMSRDVLDSMDQISSSTHSLKRTLLESIGWSGWWPFIFCPITTLIIGSYKLAPSIIRNLALLGLGEVAGFFISSYTDNGYYLMTEHVYATNSTTAT